MLHLLFDTDTPRFSAVRRLVSSVMLAGTLALGAPLVGPLPASAQTQTPSMTAPLFRLVSHAKGDHLFTTSATERDVAVAQLGYVLEGTAAYVSTTAQPGLVPLYRVSRIFGSVWDRLYTTSAAERDQAVTQGYVNDGISAYVSATPQPGLVPMYRLNNPTAITHMFTTSSAERDALPSLGFGLEGIAGYVVTPPGQLLGDPDFENGVPFPGSANAAADPWVTASYSNGHLDSTDAIISPERYLLAPGGGVSAPPEPAHSGVWNAWLGASELNHTDTLAQTVFIPAPTTRAALSFYLHIDTEETGTTAFDTLTLQILNSSGGVLGTLGTWSNVNANTGYKQQTVDVTAYKGQVITVKFTGQNDNGAATSFVIDDVTLTSQ
jgi:hypothetical protein